jgi:spermidine synthase
MYSKKFYIILLYLIIFLSGFAGLGYEMVWTRMLSIGFGHEIVAVLAVIAAFFCGLALGAWILDRIVSYSSMPGKWYAVLELIIGAWSLALVVVIPWANKSVSKLMGIEPSPFIHWSVSFFFPFVLLLPATFAMGGTLPAIERLFSRLRKDGWSVGGLYAANTFGAVIGTMITTFAIVPTFGFRKTLLLLAAMNFICAASVFLISSRDEADSPSVSIPAAGLPSSKRLYLILFTTGFLGIGYEILVIRVISQVLENTVYTFASVLSVYLLGTAFGAALYQLYAPRQRFKEILTDLLHALSVTCLVSIILLWYSESIYKSVKEALEGSYVGAIFGELALAFTIFFIPTLLMGATFSHLAQAARGPKSGLGHALSVNTLGASFAPLFFGVILLPWLETKIALVVISMGYLMLANHLRRDNCHAR